LLYEASGRTEDALRAYESALAKAPSDPDLMLRVGCGKVAAGRARQAIELLRKVQEKRQSSAETLHCLGRALLVEGTNLVEALNTLERAVEIDPHRAEYWLYVGWAANEAGRTGRAETALAKALELDQGLADAYWQRGVLLVRQGAVKDAVGDLKKALELRPSRFEAHAALADAYRDLGMEGEALTQWQKAVAAMPDNATWRFRYGTLLVANRKHAEARENLSKAIEIAAQNDQRPKWLAEAHLELARALGTNKEAVKHWKAFLTLGPRDSAYRSEAKHALEQLGQPWTGD
jgi:tetratricopeptide (TPR) repeat protein